MKNIINLLLLTFIVVLIISCATPQAQNAKYNTMINVNSSDLVIGDRIEVDGKFSDDEVQSGYAQEVLTAKALKDTEYDFILMPRLEKVRSTVTLIGRPARMK